MTAAPDGPAAGPPGSPFDVVALVTSAGGLSALNQVLLTLPDDFGAALVIVQHLGGSVGRDDIHGRVERGYLRSGHPGLASRRPRRQTVPAARLRAPGRPSVLRTPLKLNLSRTLV